MLLADLVAVADEIATISSRNDKVERIAGLLAKLEPGDVRAAVGFLSGEARQGRIGVGWATVWKLETTPATDLSLAIADLDDALTAIQQTTGPGSVTGRREIIAGLFARATAPEQDFIRRLLVGELRQGALEAVAAEAIARASSVPAATVRRALMLSGDIGLTAATALRDGEEGLRAIGLELLRPVQPMLASTADTVDEALAIAGRASVEWKLDGVRIQVHRAGEEVRVYTRNLNDVTERVPEIVAVARELPDRLVLDGEAIALDTDERPHLFQDIMSRVGRRGGEPALAMVPYFFDVLHLGGEDLIDAPLEERLRVLERIAGGWRIPGISTDEGTEANELMRTALEAGHEGVLVKSLDSTYQAGRRGKSWIKVKPARTLDLVVLGAEWGHGRRQGWLSNLHLGARDPAGGFVMVGKTFKGLTDEVLRWQTQRFLEIEERREGITVFVRREIVVEIELDGVQASPRYPGGVALRFARVLRYRPDKDPQEADTIEAVRALLPRARGEEHHGT